MTGKQLKNSILQWAIQGKLVPQDPNDEPASVLFERIRAEKARLIKEGKIKKDKNESIVFRGEDNSYYEKFADGKVVCIDDEIPFEIPESWQWVRLYHVADIQSSKRVFEKDYVSDGIPFFRSKEIGDLSRNEIIHTKLYISKELYKDLKTKYGVPKVGDILLTSVGSIGNFWICDGREFYYKDGNITQICSNAYFNSTYLTLFLGSPLFFQQITSSVSGTAYNALTIIKLKSLLFPLPPLAEQPRIVKKYQELLPVVGQYNSAQSKLDSLNKEITPLLRKTILQEAIQGRLVPQDASDEPASVLLQRIKEEKLRLVKEGKLKKKDVIDSTVFRGDDNKYYEKKGKEINCIDEEIPFEIPDSWAWVRLANVITLLSGRDLEPSQYNSEKKGIPYMTGASNFNEKYLVENRWTLFPQTISHKGDLLITCKGTIGAMAFNNIGDIHIARQIMAISSKIINLKYLELYLKLYVSDLQRAAKSIIPGISRDDMLLGLCPLPPIEEQQRIVTHIEDVFALLS